jgi:hypothetical protein
MTSPYRPEEKPKRGCDVGNGEHPVDKRDASTAGSQILTKSPLYRRDRQCHAGGVTANQNQILTKDGATIGPILSPKAIAELKAIYRKEYGEDLSDTDAWAMGHRLVRLFTILTRPPTTRGPSKGSNPVSFDGIRRASVA